MEKKKLSIIIPVYNAERYIAESIESIISNFHGEHKELEIIAVDDGSKDASGNILDKLAETYSMTLKVIHQKNGGVSKARNTGLEHMTGEFVTFLDADDVFMNNSIDKFFEMLEKYPDKDMIVFDYQDINEKGAKICSVNVTETLTDRIALDRAFILGHYFNTCWGKIIRTEIIRKTKAMFPEGVKVGEDVVFMNKVLTGIESFMTLKEELYGYRQYENSTMLTNRAKLDREHISYVADTIANKKEYAVKRGLEHEMLQEFYEKYGEVISSSIHFCMKDDLDKKQKKEDIKALVKNSVIKEVLAQIVANKNITPKRKVVSYIYLHDSLRNLYVEIYIRKYRK